MTPIELERFAWKFLAFFFFPPCNLFACGCAVVAIIKSGGRVGVPVFFLSLIVPGLLLFRLLP